MADIDIKIQVESARAQAQMNAFASQTQIASEKVKQAGLQTQILEERLNKAASAASNFKTGFKVADIALASFIGNITSRLVSSGISTIINGFRDAIQAGKNFEVGLVNIGKTTGISGQQLTNLGATIQAIGQRIPVTTDNLLEIATVAGQLGLKGSENITAFTETMAKLQLATDIAGEQGSQDVAKILTITGELEKDGVKNINTFGNVITRLGNNFAATESQILSVANEVAKGTAAFKVSSTDVLGLATAFKATGSEAETSGSSIQLAFKQIGTAVETGGDDLTKFAKAANLSNEEFKRIFENDPTNAFLALAKGIKDTSSTGAELSAKLQDLGLGSQRVSKALVPLIARYDTLSGAVSQARKESQENNALNEEATKAADTLVGDLTKLSNSFDKFSTVLFAAVGPALRLIVQGFTGLFNFFSERQGLLAILATGFTALGTTLVFASVKAVIASGAFSTTAIAASAMWVAITGPIGIAIAGLTALAATLYLVTNGFDDSAKKSKQAAENANDLAEGYNNADEQGKEFLSSVNSLTGGMEESIVPLRTVKKEFEELPAPMGAAGLIAEEVAEQIVTASAKILAFEKDKTAGLKKFFKEQEIARLEAKFAAITSEKEKEDFLSFIAQEGQKRQSEAFKKTIGLDKETLDARKAAAKELQDLRNNEDKYLEELAKKQEERLRLSVESQANAAESLRALQIFKQEGDIQFQEAQLEGIEDFLDRESKARLAAGLENVKNEEEKQTLISNAVKKGLDNQFNEFKTDKQKKAELEKKAQDEQIQGLNKTFGTIATLQNSQNKTLATLGKAAAIGQITINTAVGVTEAFKLGPILGPILAPIVIAAGVAQAAQVAGAKFEQGGIVGGSSFTGDKVQARVNSGEMILNRQQQSQLFNIANGAGGNAAPQEVVSHVTVELDGEVVGRAVSRQVANGLQLGEVQ